jgi:hypothetical protein
MKPCERERYGKSPPATHLVYSPELAMFVCDECADQALRFAACGGGKSLSGAPRKRHVVGLVELLRQRASICFPISSLTDSRMPGNVARSTCC